MCDKGFEQSVEIHRNDTKNEDSSKTKRDVAAMVIGAFLIGLGIGSIGKNKYKAKCEAYEHINWTIF